MHEVLVVCHLEVRLLLMGKERMLPSLGVQQLQLQKIGQLFLSFPMQHKKSIKSHYGCFHFEETLDISLSVLYSW